MKQDLTILYQDEHLVALDKPIGIHVHPTQLAPHEDSVMRILRDQLGQWVYTVHRLDRAVSGVLLFALSSESAKLIIEKFTGRRIEKEYLAIVRGYLDGRGTIEHALRETPKSNPASSTTEFQCLKTFELPLPMHAFPTVRYSLAGIRPLTGRQNQIRRHLAHVSHPIVGDIKFGDGRHNRLFREQFQSRRLLLFAHKLAFEHPYSNENIFIEAEIPAEFTQVIEQMQAMGTAISRPG